MLSFNSLLVPGFVNPKKQTENSICITQSSNKSRSFVEFSRPDKAFDFKYTTATGYSSFCVPGVDASLSCQQFHREGKEAIDFVLIKYGY